MQTYSVELQGFLVSPEDALPGGWCSEKLSLSYLNHVRHVSLTQDSVSLQYFWWDFVYNLVLITD